MKTMNRTALCQALACALIGWLGGGQDAAAQSQSGATTEAGSGDPIAQLDTVVVTAQSRSQEMQKVPIAMQIVGAEQIDKLAATDLSQMSLYVPGLVVGGDQPTQPSYQIRGISTSDFGIGTDAAVGIYIDGVYAGRSGATLLAFNDVQRIEVLKGPQGTLFGRNTAAGAISVVTNEPGDTFEGKVRLRAGNYGKRYGDALVNLPLNDAMALRLSFYDNQSDGWLKDADTGKRYKGDDDWGTRAVWRWDLTPDTKVTLAWDHERLDQSARPAIGLVSMSSDSGDAAAYPADSSTYLDPLHAPLYNDAINEGESRTYDAATLAVTHGFDWGEFKSTTAWHGFDTYNLGDYDGTNHAATYLDTANIEHNGNGYQEFKFSGSTDLLDWVAGASYYRERARQTSQVDTNTTTLDTLLSNTYGLDSPLAAISQALSAYGLPGLLGYSWTEAMHNRLDYDSWAAFGDVIWHLSDRLNLTTGLRFTRDHKQFSWYNAPRRSDELDAVLQTLESYGITSQLSADVQSILAALQSNLIYTDAVGTRVAMDNTWSKLSPRLVLDYALTPDSMVYGSYSKGYKAGGYDSVEVGSLFQPEDVTNYELGYKANFPRHRLQLSASAYYYRYDNIQSLTLDASTDSIVPLYLTRVSDQEAKGVDLDLQWRASAALRFNLTGAYIDSTYRRATTDEGVDLAGEPTGEPAFSFTAGMAYTWQDVFGGSLEFDLSHAYRGKSRCNRGSVEQGECDISPNFSIGSAQQRTDARLDWNSPGGAWGVALYVNNAFDKRYVTGVNNITLSTLGTPFASISSPRFWGVEFRANF